MQTNEQIIKSWLHGKSPKTLQTYHPIIAGLLTAVDKPLAEMTLIDLQAFVDSLTVYSDNTLRLWIGTVKSLFSFAHRLGYIASNTGTELKPPKPKDTLAQRTLSEEQVTQLIDGTHKGRDRTLLRFLYATGGRVAEVCALRWEHVQKVKNGGQVTFHGKGKKTRQVIFPNAIWLELDALKGNAKRVDPIFRSQMGGHLDPSRVWTIVKTAAAAAGIDGVSPHWLRHAHATHSLANGATLASVMGGLGHTSLGTTTRYIHADLDNPSSSHLNL